MTKRIRILALGQSNIANHGATRRSSANGAVFGPGAEPIGLCDPVPGGTGKDGSVWTRLADLDEFVECFGRLELALCAHSGTAVADWAGAVSEHGSIFHRLAQLRRQGFTPDLILWHQGERDNLLKTGADEYADQLEAVYCGVSAIFPSRWLISLASWREGTLSESVRQGQLGASSKNGAMEIGPDTDLLGSDFRRDNTHFNDAGLDKFAQLILQRLKWAEHRKLMTNRPDNTGPQT